MKPFNPLYPAIDETSLNKSETLSDTQDEYNPTNGSHLLRHRQRNQWRQWKNQWITTANRKQPVTITTTTNIDYGQFTFIYGIRPSRYFINTIYGHPTFILGLRPHSCFTTEKDDDTRKEIYKSIRTRYIYDNDEVQKSVSTMINLNQGRLTIDAINAPRETIRTFLKRHMPLPMWPYVPMYPFIPEGEKICWIGNSIRQWRYFTEVSKN